MANSISGINPLYFDTAGATSAVANGVWVNSIVWDSGDSGIAGDNVVLHDAVSGNVVFQATLAVAKDVIICSFAKPILFAGLYLTTLDRGVLLVYLA